MATLDKAKRIVIPFQPTFVDMSLCQTAIALYNEFSFEDLETVFSEKVYGSLVEFQDSSDDRPFLLHRIKEKVLLVPTNLRSAVWEAVVRVHNEVCQWIHDHRNISELLRTKVPFSWRTEGTIDREKTAQKLVENQTIDIRTRFEIAAKYCLVSNVKTLWQEMEAEGGTKYYETSYNGIIYFFITWIREGAKVPWTQAVVENLDPNWFLVGSVPRFTSLFRALTPESRFKFFKHLYLSDMDDLRFCLYMVTKEEQKQILKQFATKVLCMHTQWPLASLFLETANKSWEFLSHSSYCAVLRNLVESVSSPDIDYKYLAREFWDLSPVNFKDVARRSEYLMEKLDLIY